MSIGSEYLANSAARRADSRSPLGLSVSAVLLAIGTGVFFGYEKITSPDFTPAYSGSAEIRISALREEARGLAGDQEVINGELSDLVTKRERIAQKYGCRSNAESWTSFTASGLTEVSVTVNYNAGCRQ